MRRCSRTALTTALLLLLMTSAGAAVPLHSDTGEIALTDESTYRVPTKSMESTSVVVSGNLLLGIFAACTAECGSGASAYTGGMRVRAYDLATDTLAPSVQAFNDTTTPTVNSYHYQPALLAVRDKLFVFNNNDGSSVYTSCTDGAAEAPPWFRETTASLWYDTRLYSKTPQTCLRATTIDLRSSQACTDVGGVGVGDGSDSRVNDVATLALADGSALVGFETSPFCTTGEAGQAAGYYRISPAGAVSGPYIFVRGGRHTPSGSPACTNPAEGNIFSKTQFRERDGVVYAVWAPRLNAISDEWPGGSGRHAWEVFAAKSTDGGVTWTDLAGGNSWVPTYATSSAPVYNAVAYRIWNSGDIDEYVPTSFDVDSTGKLAVVVKYYTGGGNIHCGRPNQSSATNTYGLKLLRQTGAGWTETVIDATNNFHFETPAVTFDADDRLWLFKPTTTWSPTGLAYMNTADNGATWSSWTTLSTAGAADRLTAMHDPERRWVALSYIDFASDDVFMRFVRMLPLVSAPTTAAP